MQKLSLYLIVIILSVPLAKAAGQQSNTEINQQPGGNVDITDLSALPTSAPFVIRNIVITGNKKTKPSIILREVPFREGDKLPLQQLVTKFETARKQLMNTSLFHDVVVALKSLEGYNVDILVEVKERWYLFPVPYFKMVDRNINQWLVQHNASFDRVNYGLKMIYNNSTGHNDKMNMWLVSGYTRQVAMNYDRPFFDKKMKWGGKLGFTLGKNREVNYNTINNKEVFLKDSSHYIRSYFTANVELNYRPAIKTKHKFGFTYVAERVEDTIVKLNPKYFTNSRNTIRFPMLYYTMVYKDVDFIPYPLKGFEGMVTVAKKGFNKDVNVWEISTIGGHYWEIFPKTYFAVNAFGTVKLPFHQPFFNTRLMGYGDFGMQGYEYYVIDGVAGGAVKTTFSRELFGFYIPLPKTKYQTTDRIPFRIYGKIFGNTGYVYNEEPGTNSLTNRMLYSGGLGIDIVTFYDIVLKLEWSFNQLGQNGLYLHKKDCAVND
ncbi:MAG: hypothetical protein C4308_02225 [Chitinophagaceae bacterium]